MCGQLNSSYTAKMSSDRSIVADNLADEALGQEQSAREFRGALLAWFDQHRRDLPWRRSRDPYAIWVSEIMLQQTRVAAVLEHYARWMQRFPSIAALAAAEEPEVLALWSGLGYYRRARYLHAGARAVMHDHAGALPRTAAKLSSLPGIGEYTSAAIASIAFGEPVAVVDGNVERVVMRVAGLSLAQQPASVAAAPLQAAGTPADSRDAQAPGMPNSPRTFAAAPLAREIRLVASQLLSPERPGDSNQAMMELGATVCLPRAPLCLHCPVRPWCSTRGEHLAVPRKTMRSRDIAYALVTRERQGEQEVLLARRPVDASLMEGMWELPELAVPGSAVPVLTVRHAITVTNYTVRIFACDEQSAMSAASASRWVRLTHLPETALTGLTRKALKRLALWPQPVASVE